MSQIDDIEYKADSRRARIIDKNCPCCGARGARVIYQALSIPVHSCILLASLAEARAFPTRDLALAFCDECGFVFNHLYDEAIIGYSTNFEESQHFSGTFSAFAKVLARDIAIKCDVSGRQVLEIGCGKGEFLRELCDSGQAFGTGIDPGYRADKGRIVADNLQFIVDYYGPKYSGLKADLVMCRHTLEHIAPVASFVASIREAIGERDKTWVVFETPDAQRVLREGAFWDIYYEHCSYFSLGTHARLFRRQGFDVTETSLVYDGQYIVQYARPTATPTTARLHGEDDLADLRQLAAEFPIKVAETRRKWRDCIGRAVDQGKRVVLWGGGSKAVSFLVTLGLLEEIAAVVDVNPYKQGKYLPGTGHSVVAPAELTSLRPDLVVVMNPIYVSEIGEELSSRGLQPEILAL